MKMTLRQLAAFDAVAALGSITRAAEDLNMSQSAVSAALKDLQVALGRPPLVRRVGRGIELTAEGRKLQPRIRSFLIEAEEIENPQEEAELTDTLVVGLTDASVYVVPPLMAEFRRRHPGVRIDVVVGQSQDLVARLSSLTIDFVVTDNMARAPGSVLSELYRERSVLIAASSHPLAALDSPGFADLEAAEWCLPDRITVANVRLHDAIRGHITNLKAAMEVSSEEGVREAVKAGVGVSCLPLSLVKDDLASGRLVELKPPGFEAVRPTYLMRMRNVKSTLAARMFEAHVLAYFADGVRP